MKDPKKVKAGKLSKDQGAAFEPRVRKDLESKGWIVDRWSNNVEWSEGNIYVTPAHRTGKLVPSKVTFRRTPGGMFPLGLNSGFPDFIAFKMHIKGEKFCEGITSNTLYKIIGVESKMTGELDTQEKDKCEWLLENEIFSQILIARKTKEIKTKCFWCSKFYTNLESHSKEKHPKLNPRTYGETKEGNKIVVVYEDYEEIRKRRHK